MRSKITTIIQICLILSACLAASCGSAQGPNADGSRASSKPAANGEPGAAASVEKPPGAGSIDIAPGGPADTVRVFYAKLRDKKYREAIFLTNLRPAIESLTDAELAEFSLDLAAIAGQVPADVIIKGEVISGSNAIVTAVLPDADGEAEPQQIKLRQDGSAWIILSADAAVEKRIRSEGKRYFYNLRIEVKESEAQKMLERIAKAQVAYSLQNEGSAAELNALVAAGLLADDVLSSDSTGYDYSLTLTAGGRRYFATATPAEYGKTGKRSFALSIDEKGLPHVSGRDNGGKPLKK